MFFSPSFANKSSSSKDNFDIKFKKAIELIKRNHSIVAPKVLEAIDLHRITVNSFFNMSEEHYQEMQEDMLEENSIILPTEYPPTAEAVKLIEGKLSGIIYEDKHIYLSSRQTTQEIASTLVHEICHFLNRDIYRRERKTSSSQLFRYKDEVRSFTAEKIFERDGHCLRRSDIKKIHTRVAKAYSEFLQPNEDTQKLGYIYSSFDAPMK